MNKTPTSKQYNVSYSGQSGIFIIESLSFMNEHVRSVGDFKKMFWSMTGFRLV